MTAIDVRPPDLAGPVVTTGARDPLGAALRVLRPLGSGLAALLVVLLLWYGFIDFFNIDPLVAKSPTDVAKYLFSGSQAGAHRSSVASGLGVTMHDASLGFVGGLVAASVVALVFVLFRPIEQAMLPIAVLVRSVPLVAMTPVLTLVFGRGLLGTMVISGILVFFPALVTIVFGLRSTSKQAVDLCRAYGANGWTVARKVMPGRGARGRRRRDARRVVGHRPRPGLRDAHRRLDLRVRPPVGLRRGRHPDLGRPLLRDRGAGAGRARTVRAGRREALTADLLITGATLVATCDDDRRELAGGWVAVTDGAVSGVGAAGELPPAAEKVLDARGCLVTPGLVNTHHHLYQNLTRSYAPVVNGSLFTWLTGLYPVWAGIDEQASYLSTWVGLAELALGGCTTTSDHLYIAPRDGGDLWTAQVEAAREVGLRFHPTRGSMTLSTKDGGLPPDSVVQDDDEVLADSQRLVEAHHDPRPGSMLQVALAPCSPFSVSPDLMRRTAELAEELDVRLHTHLAEDPDEDAFCLERFGRRPVEQFEEVGWLTDRSWVAHCIYPSAAEVARLGRAGVGVAHCPSSNMLIGGGGFAPVRDLRAAGSPVGLGCDGSASTDSASLWLESRTALLLSRQRAGPAGGLTAREVLEVGTRGGAACLGRAGELGQLSVGAAGDLVCWPQEGVAFAGALSDPVEAWLRCGPTAARHTVVAGRVLVEDGELRLPGLDDVLARHRAVAARLQGIA